MTLRAPTLHVLVLDDDEKVLRMFQLFTKQEKTIDVYTGSNGREGLDLMVKHAFDLVIVDVNMPVMDGLDFTREVRKIWPWQEIFFCTGHVSEALKKQAQDLGVKQILEKPLSRNQLKSAIDSSRSSREFHISHGYGIAPSNAGTVACLQKLRHLSARVWKTPRLSTLVSGFLEFLEQWAPVNAAAVLIDDGTIRRYESFHKGNISSSVHETLYTGCRERLHAITGRDWVCDVSERHRQSKVSDGGEPIDLESAVYLPLMGRRSLLGMLVLVPYPNISLEPGDFPIVYHAAHHLSTLFQSVSEIQRQGMKDPLTGLYNRRYLQAELERFWLLGQRENIPFGLLMLDLDGFKALNDQHGHTFGDSLLKHVARILLETLRRSDLVIRLGGDEFVIILPQTDAGGTRELAERLRQTLETQPVRKQDNDLKITTSIGAVVFDKEDPVRSSMQLLECADRAMYAAKHEGGNRIAVWKACDYKSLPPLRHEVLIVDDDPQVLNLLRRMLNGDTYNVTTVTSVAEAERLLAEGQTFELLLTDLSLPIQDGYEMLAIARERDPDMISLVITGHITKHSEESLHDQGAFDIIPKPFHPNMLRNKLHEALEHRAFRLRSR
ncbi:MAG: diguanylate cyclase [Verrucomicrobia bacterium]|nr:diguanylate cyclase [Verrucomicrobiota bacterium]MCH8527853.1 diguanylate cyclase [Kiritimatiellia bacterium]